jgi:hypothetical protein
LFEEWFVPLRGTVVADRGHAIRSLRPPGLHHGEMASIAQINEALARVRTASDFAGFIRMDGQDFVRYLLLGRYEFR